MRKEQLVRALVKVAKQKSQTRKSDGHAASGKATRKPRNTRLKSGASQPSRIARKLRRERNHSENLKNLAMVNERENTKKQPDIDRVILIVRDPFWLQAYWEITQQTMERVRVALADSWFKTHPVLRLLEVTSDCSTGSDEKLVRQIPIHGGVRNWYVDVVDPPKSYRVELGFASGSGKFFLIAKSNQVTTPAPDQDTPDYNWVDIQDDYKKYYAMSGGYTGTENAETGDELQSIFEAKLRRPMNAPAFVRLGNGINNDNHDFDFDVDAHMVVKGKANPGADVTLAGEPVKLRMDGSFTVSMEMPDKRQVLPIVASSRDGTQRRTVVLAVERNTKVMEPVSKQLDEF